MVKTLRDQFLARTPFTDHQHRPVERRGAARALHRVEERQTLADELVRPLHNLSFRIWPTVGGKSHDLARIFMLISPANGMNLRNSTVFQILARSLYNVRQ